MNIEDEVFAKVRTVADAAIENELENFRIMLTDKGYDADDIEAAVEDQLAFMLDDLRSQLRKFVQEVSAGGQDRVGASLH
jgi:hypothetical protein